MGFHGTYTGLKDPRMPTIIHLLFLTEIRTIPVNDQSILCSVTTNQSPTKFHIYFSQGCSSPAHLSCPWSNRRAPRRKGSWAVWRTGLGFSSQSPRSRRDNRWCLRLRKNINTFFFSLLILYLFQRCRGIRTKIFCQELANTILCFLHGPTQTVPIEWFTEDQAFSL